MTSRMMPGMPRKPATSALMRFSLSSSPIAAPITEANLPEQFRPLGAWAYFGLMLLYAIPVVGFVFLIVFSFSKGNINRRNFARSYWCWVILVIALILIGVVILLTGILRGGKGWPPSNTDLPDSARTGRPSRFPASSRSP